MTDAEAMHDMFARHCAVFDAASSMRISLMLSALENLGSRGVGDPIYGAMSLAAMMMTGVKEGRFRVLFAEPTNEGANGL